MPIPGGVIDPKALWALLDHAHDAIIVRRLDGEILYWNKGAERTYGWTPDEASGQNAYHLLRALLPKPAVTIEEALRQQGEWQGRVVHSRKDGELVTAEARWALEGNGGLETVLEINRDITARLEAQDAARARELQLRFVTDSAPVLIAHCDTEHRFKFVNRPYAAFGLQPSQLVGRRIADVLGERAYETIKPYIARALSGEPIEVELEVPYETIGMQFMRFAYQPELDDAGQVVGYVAAVVNVSDRHKAEEALREADRRKDAFLATLAHELRNPLAAMRNAAHLLTAPLPDAASAERMRAIIERQLKQLVRLVDDLLDVSRITRGQLQLRFRRVELSAIVATAVEATATASASQTLTVSLPEDQIFLDADAERLSQVLTNLLTNATKYTPAGGEIKLSAEAAAGEVVIVVSDTGVGIPPDMLESVFGMFTQLDHTRDQAYGGLGIGLTLVRFLIDLHDGTVAAESDGIGRGSRFIVRLPLAARSAHAGSDKETMSNAEGTISKRVLIADDNADAAESLQMLLQMAGHDVHVALDGVRALAVVESLRPHVAFLDLAMPGLNGFDVARRVREFPWGRDVVLVALTGWGQEEDRRRTADAGFDHHLTKPVAPDDIEALINRI
jgi:PAS domain S-box-containing protein